MTVNDYRYDFPALLAPEVTAPPVLSQTFSLFEDHQ